MKEQIISLLGEGLSTTQVATAVGCDPSYVSQILNDEASHQEVMALRAENFAKYVTHDNNIVSAEEAALKKVQDLVGFISKPSEAAKVFGILNAAKKRTQESAQNATAPATIVNITLPQQAAVAFTVNTEKQVVEIEGRNMATLPAKNLVQRLQQKQAAALLDNAPKIPRSFSVPTIVDSL
jgi:transcriptional regulator with XRE-family HTH domain